MNTKLAAKPKSYSPRTDRDSEGRRYYLESVHPPGARVIVTRTIVDKRYRKKYSNFQDLYQLALQAESEYALDANGLDIIRITRIEPGSIIEQLGFRKGDEIYSVNGYPAADEDEAFGLYEMLKSKDDFFVELVRNGRRMTMHFRFE
ncbi:MAG: hypothetical protein ACYS8W_15490 [Planctomycetota bacterium]